MASIHLVKEDATTPVVVPSGSPSSWTAWGYVVGSAVLLAIIGTWLVWFSAFIQRDLQEQDIRAACGRAMPDQTERCFDTVVIQRGGVRR